MESYVNVPDDPKYPGTRERVEFIQNETIKEVRRRGMTNMLLGLNTSEWNGQKYLKYNSALLIRPNEDQPYGDRYDKMHLVPFGEYVPFRETLPFMKKFSPYDWDYSCTPGNRYNTMDFAAGKRRYSFGVMICYEDSDPYFARQYNPFSNDGWFRGSEEHEQHLAICRFRAVESRRTVVRSVNMGISAVIDPDGRMVAMQDLDDWSKSKSVVAVVTHDIPVDDRDSIYAALGDWVPLLCWLIIFGVLIQARLRRKTA
jgi:apolipoprotein N-acyltransferase